MAEYIKREMPDIRKMPDIDGSGGRNAYYTVKDAYLYRFDDAKIRHLIQLSKCTSNSLQTQDFAGGRIFREVSTK